MNRAEIAWWIDAAARLLADEAEQPAPAEEVKPEETE